MQASPLPVLDFSFRVTMRRRQALLFAGCIGIRGGLVAGATSHEMNVAQALRRT